MAPTPCVGMDEIDALHVRWMPTIVAIHAAGFGHLPDQIGMDAARNALEKLLSYTRTHFSIEEQLMAKSTRT